MPFWNPFGRSKKETPENKTAPIKAPAPKAPASNTLTSRNFYLGVASVEAAFNAVDELSFCEVLNRHTGQIRIQNDNRIQVVVGPADGDSVAVRTEDTLLWIGGQFTPDEMAQIEGLAKHSNPRALKKVAVFVAGMAAQGC